MPIEQLMALHGALTQVIAASRGALAAAPSSNRTTSTTEVA